MTAAARADIDKTYSLEDRYRKERGRVFITGTQALVRLPLAQRRLDRARGLNTAGFVSGYRGSPLAGYDQALHQARKLLEAEDVRFVPGLNEELAAVAVMGSQQVEAEGHGRYDGVFGLWYGKGPGVDRAGDAIKHGHAYGTSPHGGVLCVAGDDHGAVSSTIAHQSDQAFAAWWMPVLNPASVRDYLELGLWGWAASRFSGGWVGFKAISETVESASAFELPDELPVFATPEDFATPPGGLHFRWQDPPSVAIEERLARKLDAVRAFARANPVDRLRRDGSLRPAGIRRARPRADGRARPQGGAQLPARDRGPTPLRPRPARDPRGRGEAPAGRGPDQGSPLPARGCRAPRRPRQARP
jgi:indolepyruvate ferredoxin oxidoreductase